MKMDRNEIEWDEVFMLILMGALTIGFAVFVLMGLTKLAMLWF